MSFLRVVGMLIWKDLRVELRTKEMVLAMTIFGVLVLVVFSFSFDPGLASAEEIAPGILWVAVVFSGILGLNRSMVAEVDQGTLPALLLCPVDRSALFLGKAISNLTMITIVEAVVLALFAVFFRVSLWGVLPQLVLVLLLGTIGFAALGTLLAGISANTRAREMLFPLLQLPLAVPVLIAAVKSTSVVLHGGSLAEIAGWLKLLGAFDIVYLVLGCFVFEKAIEP